MNFIKYKRSQSVFFIITWRNKVWRDSETKFFRHHYIKGGHFFWLLHILLHIFRSKCLINRFLTLLFLNFIDKCLRNRFSLLRKLLLLVKWFVCFQTIRHPNRIQFKHIWANRSCSWRVDPSPRSTSRVVLGNWVVDDSLHWSFQLIPEISHVSHLEVVQPSRRLSDKTHKSPETVPILHF